ncbi:uncharacterized protein LOC132354518 [Balaenoptera ricei]|uniref:uncharacterized protein LOC132354518 n=1 Tax=Balaenoptera ricei TaxID=2746895 RepID=UPI0028BEF01A|nr:uncharacterized protein LOC132354518 [Balaenoptera ricei]
MSVLELYLVYLGAKVRVAALLLLAGRLLAHPGGERCHQHLGRFLFAVLCGLPLSGCCRRRRGADPGAARARSCPCSPPLPRKIEQKCAWHLPRGLEAWPLSCSSVIPNRQEGSLLSPESTVRDKPIPSQSPRDKGELPRARTEASAVTQAVFCLQICSQQLPPPRGCPTGDLVKKHEAQEQHGLACQGAQEESQPWGQPPTPPCGRTSSSRTWPPALEGLRRAQLPSPLLPFQRLKAERSLSHRPPGRDAPCQSIQTRHTAMELVAQLQHSRAPHHPSAQGARSPHQVPHRPCTPRWRHGWHRERRQEPDSH